MNNKIIYVIILVVAVILITGIYFLFWQNIDKNIVVAPTIENTSGIEILSPTLNQVISSPLKITGMVHGDGYNGFEGQVGTVELVYQAPLKGNAMHLATGVLTATTDWTVLPTHFQTNLEFTAPDAVSGYLIFHNENPSGMPEKDKTFILPIKFK